jgi:hypothetical protein
MNFGSQVDQSPKSLRDEFNFTQMEHLADLPQAVLYFFEGFVRARKKISPKNYLT